MSYEDDKWENGAFTEAIRDGATGVSPSGQEGCDVVVTGYPRDPSTLRADLDGGDLVVVEVQQVERG